MRSCISQIMVFAIILIETILVITVIVVSGIGISYRQLAFESFTVNIIILTRNQFSRLNC